MKVFLRLFTGILTLMIISFAVFGTLFFHSSFRALQGREISANEDQTKMIIYSLLTAVDSVENEYVPGDSDFSDIMGTLFSNFSVQNSGMSLYDSGKNPIYVRGSIYEQNGFSEKLINGLNKNESLQKIALYKNRHYVVSVSVVKINDGKYYLSVSQDIEYLYIYRNDMYRYYCILVGSVLLLTIILSLLLAYRFTKPIAVLSKASMNFAEGDYDRRVQVTGNDEITDMMVNFNIMAAKISDNIFQLSESARRQEEFTGAFAHELKTPLTAIIGYSDMLKTMKLSEEDRIMSADYIYSQGKRLERLSHSMLELCSMSNTKIQKTALSIEGVVRESIDMVDMALKKAGIKVEYQIEEGNLWGEHDLLVTLLVNILDNGRKACEADKTANILEEGKTEKINKDYKTEYVIEISGIKQADKYNLQIRDNGCGIPKEDISKVKEAFFMVDKSRARKAGGAGLGLALCTKIVELHGAKMDIHSELGMGTVIILEFREKTDENIIAQNI